MFQWPGESYQTAKFVNDLTEANEGNEELLSARS
jgi:hypothetical protein